MAITYKKAGVDWKKADLLIRNLKQAIESTHGKEVKKGIGGFAALYDVGGGRYLAAGTDGVGTKLKFAQALQKHDTIGIDLVAMCVNDVICIGARPLFFLDYFAIGKLEVGIAESILAGVIHGCRQSGAALIGGETAEMPGVYPDGEYDLAGFCVGEVYKKDIVDGSKVKVGDELVALPSSGIHSNGFSLVRKLVREDEQKLMLECLTPTKIYVKPVLSAMGAKKFTIKGLAHITGSGFYNVLRINPKFGYEFTNLPTLAKLFKTLQERAELSDEEMYSTFNMGMGMLLVTDNAAALVKHLRQQDQEAHIVGKVVKKNSVVVKRGSVDIELKPHKVLH